MIVKFMNFLHDHWVGVILLMTFITFLLWAVGYIANGLYGTHFELASCWAGFGAIATAAVSGFGKLYVDNKFNQTTSNQ